MAELARSGGAVWRPQLGKHSPHGARAAFLGPASYRQLRQTRLGLWIMDCAKNNSRARNIRTSHPYGLSHIYPHAICISICIVEEEKVVLILQCNDASFYFVFICYVIYCILYIYRLFHLSTLGFRYLVGLSPHYLENVFFCNFHQY